MAEADSWDAWARAVVEDLVGRGALELVTEASRRDVEALLAQLFADGKRRGSFVAARLIDNVAVAELSCDDATLTKLIDSHASLVVEVDRHPAPPASSSAPEPTKPHVRMAPVRRVADPVPADDAQFVDDDAEERTAGVLAVSEPFERSVRILSAYGFRSGDERPSEPRWRPELALADVMQVERELGAFLPDDFWAAAMSGIFAPEGVAVTEDGEPAPLDEIKDIVTRANAGAVAQLVVLVDHGDNGVVGIRPGASFRERNSQPIVRIRDGESTEYVRFGSFLASEILRAYGDEKLKKLAAPFRPRLVGEREVVKSPRRIRHPKFGIGLVKSVSEGASGRKLEVAFEDGCQRVLLESRIVEVGEP